MARGKAAAQAANRRLADALETIALLEQRLAEQAAAHAAEAAGLRTELKRARGTTARQVKTMADDAIAEARADGLALAKDATDKHLAQVIAGLVHLESLLPSRIELRLDQWPDVAESFGVHAGPLMAGWMEATGDGSSVRRALKRSTNATARWKSRIIEIERDGDMDDLPGMGGVRDPRRTV